MGLTATPERADGLQADLEHLIGPVVFDIPISVVPFYYDYLVRVNSSINEANTLTASIFGSHDEIKLIDIFTSTPEKRCNEFNFIV